MSPARATHEQPHGSTSTVWLARRDDCPPQARASNDVEVGENNASVDLYPVGSECIAMLITQFRAPTCQVIRDLSAYEPHHPVGLEAVAGEHIARSDPVDEVLTYPFAADPINGGVASDTKQPGSDQTRGRLGSFKRGSAAANASAAQSSAAGWSPSWARQKR